MKNKIIISAILILCIVITSKIVSDNSVEKTNNFISTPNNQNKYSNQQVDFVFAAEKSIETVVHIKSKFLIDNIYRYYDPFEDFFFGDGYKYYNKPKERSSSGSGVIISSDGYIVTNNHVINKAKEIEVVMNNNQVYDAELIGTDETTDLALLKIKANNLPHISFSNSDNVKVGQWVLAVGNPFNLNSTVTAGIISAKGRSLNLLNNPHAIESFLQTDAAINPGNSGGALINENGNLVGINSKIFSKTGAYQGIGFAIPSNLVVQISSELIQFGKIRTTWIGNFRVTRVRINLESGVVNALKIVEIDNFGPLYEKGVRANDIIIEINEEAGTWSNLTKSLRLAGLGNNIKLKLYTKKEYKYVEINSDQIKKINLGA